MQARQYIRTRLQTERARIKAGIEQHPCQQCGQRRACTRLRLTVCLVCAGLLPELVDPNES